MNRKKIGYLAPFFLVLSILAACGTPNGQNSSSSEKSSKSFDLPSLFIGNNQSLEKDANGNIVDTKDGKLVNKASNADPSGSNSSQISQPNTPSSSVPTASPTPTSTPTASPSTASGAGQLNIQINPVPPTQRNTL
ncbi:MAG: hypothetical protein U0457_14240 [Candidatus Sericytochromatia bacterium]